MANVTVSTAANFIPEIWSKEIVETAHKNLVYVPLFDHTWEADARMGDNINVPNLAELSASDKSASSDVTFTANTEGTTQIAISTHKYVAVKVEDIVELQANQSMRARYTREMGRALAQAMDTDAAGLPDDFTQTVGTINVDFTDDDIIEAERLLDAANAAAEDRFLVVHPNAKATILKMEKFVNKDYEVVSKPGLNPRGLMGGLYNFSIYVSSNVEANGSGHDNAAFQREAVAWVQQQNIRSQSMYIIESLAWALVADTVYGFKEMRDTFGVWVKGK